MNDEKVIMDSVQKKAFDILFAEIKEVKLAPQNGGKQDRIADPMGKIASLFSTPDEAKSFIAMLDGLRLFADMFPCGAVRVSAERWLDVSDAIEVIQPSTRPAAVAMPKPYSREETEIVAKRRAGESLQIELRTRRVELERQLHAIDAAIAVSEREVAGLDELLVKARSFREQWGKFFPDADVVQEVMQ